MRVPNDADVLEIRLDVDDEVTEDLTKGTARKEAGEVLTEEQIEKNSGLDIPPADDEEEEEEPESGQGGGGKKSKATNYKRSAESIVLSIDFAFQTGVGEILLPLKAFSADERRIISKNRRIFKSRMKAEEKGIEKHFPFFDDETNELLYQRWADLKDFTEEEMPLDDDEIKRNVDAWQRVLEFYQKEPGPWPHLLTTITATYGKRITPIFAI